MPVLRLIIAFALLTVGSALVATPASARQTGACVPGGPTCQFWFGKVKLVADGDTIDVDIAGDGTSKVRRVRTAGYNAMELSRYSNYAARRRGECHGVTAANRLQQLIGRRRKVRLAAQHASSYAQNGRLRRQVSVLMRGQWVDVGPIMLSEGRALAFPASDEWVWNQPYAAAARGAAGAGLGVWNPFGCGAGPSAGVTMGLEAQYHAYEVDERKYLNSEWVKILNPSPTPVSLAGWWVRDSSLLRYTFPASAVVPPGGQITLYVGSGTNRPGEAFYWGLRKPPFNNPSKDFRHNGDGAYLFDSRGNMRAHVVWGG